MKFFLALIALSMFISCQSRAVDKMILTNSSTAINKINFKMLSVEEGNQMLVQNCYTCHNPKAPSLEDTLAPPLMEIKYK